MRITIEPTCGTTGRYTPDAVPHKVVVEHPLDDLTLDHILRLMVYALRGVGFDSGKIVEYMADLDA